MLEKINDRMPGHLTGQALRPIPALAAGAGTIPGHAALHSSPRGPGGAGLQRDFTKGENCQLTPAQPSLACPLTTERAEKDSFQFFQLMGVVNLGGYHLVDKQNS